MAAAARDRLWGGKTGRGGGFTLVEAVVSVLLLGILLGGVMVAHERTCDAVARQSMRTRAAAVAERQIELLMASRQEPNSPSFHGEDEQTPEFTWQMDLQRVPVGEGAPGSAASSVIQATVRVYTKGERSGQGEPLIELVRCFGTSELTPVTGESVAVPFMTEEELIYQDLENRLGREPTLIEVLQEMVDTGQFSQEEGLELMEGLEGGPEALMEGEGR